MQIYDPSHERYEVPVASQLNLQYGSDSGLSVSFQEGPFSIKVSRDSDGAVL